MVWLSDGDPFDFIVQTLETLDFSLTLMLVDNSMFNFYRENSFAIEFRVIGGGWVVALLILLSAKVLFRCGSISRTVP